MPKSVTVITGRKRYCIMGCSGSGAVVKSTTTEQRKIPQVKAPVLLFYLPGTVKEAMCSLIAPEANSGNINIRFMDAQNHRNARRYWAKELQGRKDYAAAIMLADCRDHPTMMMTARTVNWFIRLTYKTHDVKIMALYSKKEALEEFRSYVSKEIEITGLSASDPESVQSYVSFLQLIEQRFAEQKKTATTTTRSII